jgi:zinc transport system permease protein
MAYFGDALAHSGLLGVALGLVLGINVTAGIVVVCGALAILLVFLRRGGRLADDTLLGILSHGSLSLGLIAIALMESMRVDLISYLFGDVLAVTPSDIAAIYVGGIIALGALAALWRPLVAISVHEELARVEGVPVVRVQLAFMLLIALVIALAMKVVGILLVTSLIIIPAAAVRRFSPSPEHMAALASVAGCAAVAGGLWLSFAFDMPSGPSIVVAAFILFVLSALTPPFKRLS